MSRPELSDDAIRMLNKQAEDLYNPYNPWEAYEDEWYEALESNHQSHVTEFLKEREEIKKREKEKRKAEIEESRIKKKERRNDIIAACVLPAAGCILIARFLENTQLSILGYLLCIVFAITDLIRVLKEGS